MLIYVTVFKIATVNKERERDTTIFSIRTDRARIVFDGYNSGP